MFLGVGINGWPLSKQKSFFACFFFWYSFLTNDRAWEGKLLQAKRVVKEFTQSGWMWIKKIGPSGQLTNGATATLRAYSIPYRKSQLSKIKEKDLPIWQGSLYEQNWTNQDRVWEIGRILLTLFTIGQAWERGWERSLSELGRPVTTVDGECESKVLDKPRYFLSICRRSRLSQDNGQSGSV